MSAVFVVGILVALAIVYLTAPLRRPAIVPESLAKEDPLDERKRMALAAIVDIEDERALGKLSDDDFTALRAGYEREAVAALRAIDTATDAAVHEDDDLESEIAALRESMTCRNCGALMSGDRCARCDA